MVNAAPVGQSNMGIDATQFKGEQISKLDMTETFGTFHWKTEKNGSRVDRVFTLELSEAAEFQITDFMMGKYKSYFVAQKKLNFFVRW